MLRRLLHRLRGAAPPTTSPASARPRARSRPAPPPPWSPADPAAWTLAGAFHPDFLAAAGDADRLVALARPVHPGLWALPVLSPAWCEAHRAEVAAYERWAARAGVEVPAPNTMNRYGLILDSTFGPVSRLVDLTPLREALLPLTGRLLPEVGGATLDGHHGFVVRYGMDGDRDLALHADDAEVTLNLCLGGGFEGGELWFEGRRCGPHHGHPARPEERYTWAHQPGVALLHAGSHRHGARPLRRGARDNLILWMRAEALRAVDHPDLGFGPGCPAWCGARSDP